MKVGCLYIPSFSAWTFRRKGDEGPIIVVASGQVVAATRTARACGVEPGIPVNRALALCPEASLKLRDAALEEAAWEEVLHALHQITPFLEGNTPPFAYFKPDDIGCFRELAADLKGQAGIAPDRPTAQLAALRAARGNTLVLRKHVVREFLRRFPVERLIELDFDEDLTEQLCFFGYPSLDAIQSLSRRHLSAQFGEAGERLFALLHPGEETRISIYRFPRTIRVEFDFDHPCREPADLLPALEHLVGRAVSLLRRERCQRLALSLQDYRSGTCLLTSRIVAEPLGSARSLMNAAAFLLRQLLSASLEVATLSLELGSLRQAHPLQVALFRARPSTHKAVKAVHRRFPGAIRRAVMQPDVLFSEDEVRLEAL